jgi:hypothetical protein
MSPLDALFRQIDAPPGRLAFTYGDAAWTRKTEFQYWPIISRGLGTVTSWSRAKDFVICPRP